MKKLLIAVFLLAGLHVAPVAAQSPQATESITVDLLSGRTFTALIDPKTDAKQLWLRWEHGTAVMQRPIRWDRVVRAKVAGVELTGEELHQIVVTIRKDMPVPKKSNIIRLEPSSTFGITQSYAKPFGQWGQYNNGPNARYNRYSRATGTTTYPRSAPAHGRPSAPYYPTNPYTKSNSYGRYGP